MSFLGNNQFSGFTVEQRFWQKVDKRSDDECWEWLGAKDKLGYGFFGFDGKVIKSHRYSWAINKGEIPDGLLVCHHCDNPPCVNPSHLFLGTDKDNSIDKVKKGRSSKGEGIRTAKLTQTKVRDIRRLFSLGVSKTELSALYGMSRPNIHKIVFNMIWKHVV